MYKKLREELINENLTLLDRMKSMGVNIWPGTDRTVEDVMMEVDKNSQEILRKKFGYGENQKLNNEKDIKSYYFITVNLGQSIDQVKDLYEAMLQCCYKYKWMRKSIYNIEYYTARGHHAHAHIYVDTNKRKDTIIALLAKFFNIEKNFLDVKRYYGNPINHINYIKGVKKDESKKEYIEKDKYMRDEFNIPEYIDNINNVYKEQGGNEQEMALIN